MEQQMREMNYDARRAPLGKLTEGQIKAGYTALKEISKCIDELEKLNHPAVTATGKRKVGSAPKRQPSNAKKSREIREALLQACNQFYTRIPHDFG